MMPDMPGTHVVATVAGRPIPIERLEERVAEVRSGPRGRHVPPDRAYDPLNLHRWIVQELVTEEVLLHEARTAGLVANGASTADRRRGDSEVERARWASVVAALVERVTAHVTVSARDVREYYRRNHDLYRRPESCRVRHILVASQASARRIARRLKQGDDMAALAAAVSIDAGSRALGGDLGDVRRGELAGPFEGAVFGAESGALVGPFRTEHGWHVARVEAFSPESFVPFAEARPAIETALLTVARSNEFEAWLEGRRAALAVIEPDFEHPSHPINGVPHHRH